MGNFRHGVIGGPGGPNLTPRPRPKSVRVVEVPPEVLPEVVVVPEEEEKPEPIEEKVVIDEPVEEIEEPVRKTGKHTKRKRKYTKKKVTEVFEPKPAVYPYYPPRPPPEE